MARGKVRIDIAADATGVKRGVDDAERSLSRLKSSGTKALKSLQIASIATGAAIGVGLAAAVRTGTQELLEQEKASAQTAAALKSTGNAANVTRKQIEDMSGSLQASTGIADDQIQSMQNLLLTFTNIKNVGPDKIFSQATRTALDLSVAFHKDLNGSAILVGKALNDPIKGLSALNRVGVQFTKDQKDQIKTMVESGRTLDAQKLILSNLNKQVGGSAVAMGNTTAGQLERIKRAWEDTSEELVRQFLPIFTQVARGVLRNMDKVRAVFQGIRVFAQGMVNFVKALFEGDWQKAWDIAAEGAGRALSALGTLAQKVLYPMAIKMGKAIAKGLADGLDTGLRSLPGGSAIARFLGLGASGTVDLTGNAGRDLTGLGQPPAVGRPRAGGGFTEGPYRGYDDRLVPLAGNEAVLNPRQQAMVPGGRSTLEYIFRATGAGGFGYASGGFVSSAAERARSNLGEPYGKPSRGQSRTGPNSWDCSGFATFVAGVNVGGTTASAYGASSPAKGTEPIIWGFRKTHSGGYRGGYDEHMGVRVDGVWYQTSSGRTAQTGADGDWQELRVPNGLRSIASDGDGPGGEAARGSGRTIGPVESLTKLLRKGFGIGEGGKPSNLSRARELLSDSAGVTDFSSMASRGTDLTSAQRRSVDNIGRLAAQQARDAGILDPQEIAKRQNEAERNEEIRVLRQHVSLIDGDLKRLHTKKGQNLREIRKIKSRKNLKRGEKARLVRLLTRQNSAITNEMDDLREQRAEINARLMEIGEQIAAEADQAAYDAATAASEATAADSAVSADAQAQIDQANQRAQAASLQAQASDAFIRSLNGSGSINPGAVGTTIINNINAGAIVRQGDLANFIVGNFANQSFVRRSIFPSAA